MFESLRFRGNRLSKFPCSWLTALFVILWEVIRGNNVWKGWTFRQKRLRIKVKNQINFVFPIDQAVT